MLSTILGVTQFAFTMIIGMYFLSALKNQHDQKPNLNEETKRDMERLNKLRRIHLSEPLTEQTRPKNFDEIIGQKDGVKAVRVALCGPNPQHILIYGPPGVGKTAASRLAMEEAKRSEGTPFLKDAVFIEVDANTMHYDERSIADPLIGSVHDPIYQGASALGVAGIPQPKEGAVSKAHGGVLFIDEIGELQPIQLNRLLKVLEDRKVHFESAYYSEGNKNIPRYIHELFQNGMPADFRLIGATTRSPEEIPPAVRSRCVEIFFNSLTNDDLIKIIDNALHKLNISMSDDLKKKICRFTANGRDVVKILETVSAKLNLERRGVVSAEDVDWVIRCGRYRAKYTYSVSEGKKIGVVNGLAVSGDGVGLLMPIEVSASPSQNGRVCYGGICENETIKFRNRTITGKSSARTSLDNVLTVLSEQFGINVEKYNITVNFPGGMPVDGPSAGITIFAGIYSAIKKIGIDQKIAFTGEISVLGEIFPVGGIMEKIEAAKNAGAKRVIIPYDNFYPDLERIGIEIMPIKNVKELWDNLFEKECLGNVYNDEKEVIVASGILNEG